MSSGLTLQQRWLLDQIGDAPDTFVAVRLDLHRPGIRHHVGIVQAHNGGRTIRVRSDVKPRLLLRAGIYQTLLSLIGTGILASVKLDDDYGELYWLSPRGLDLERGADGRLLS